MTMRALMLAAAAAAALAVALPNDATAGFQNGNKLHDICVDGASKPLEFGLCVGYIEGAYDTLVFSRETTGEKNGSACVPLQASVRQITELVVAFLKAHPETRHYSAPSLISDALDDAFKCRD
jgi:hypothetical protein